MRFLSGLVILALFPGCAAARQPVIKVQDTAAGTPARYAGNFSSSPVYIPVKTVSVPDMRGIWVATIENLDFKQSSSPAEFQKQFRKIIANLKAARFNAIFFQVRPMNDAFYPSKFNPSSRFMLGKEGGSMGNFDPLKFMIAESHRNGIEFHAWLNPYRVNSKSAVPKAEYIKTLSPQNFARKNPETVLDCKVGKVHSLFLDPGHPLVQQHIFNTVEELAANYDIDGIHFDDYFYLYDGVGNVDQQSFKRYNPGKRPLAEWRRENVNTVICGVSKRLHKISREKNKKIRFGVSPFGIWANRKNMKKGSLSGGKESYFAQYADTRLWVKSGWIDYIAPQLYWAFSHNTAAYAALTDWWCQTVKGTKVKLYIGHAVYRLGESKQYSADELYWQLLYNSARPAVSGSIFFRYSNVFSPSGDVMEKGVKKALQLWKP